MLVCVLFFCEYRNICDIVILCAEVSLHNRIGLGGGADMRGAKGEFRLIMVGECE